MRYSRVPSILRMIVQEPGYRRYIKDTLFRPVNVEVSSNLPERMAKPIAQLAMHVNNTPCEQLENPVSLFGFQIGYLVEQQFRYLIREIFIEGCYFFHVEKPDPVILDCGSNIGLSIMFFKALYPEACVIGFEPEPTTFTQLAENVRANRLANVELHNIALSASDGDIDFFVPAEEVSSLFMSAYKERLSGVRITVPAKRL